MTKTVVQEPNNILHKQAESVRDFDEESLKQLIKDMHETVLVENGVGLAAPQIGVSLSVFVIPEEHAPEVRF